MNQTVKVWLIFILAIAGCGYLLHWQDIDDRLFYFLHSSLKIGNQPKKLLQGAGYKQCCPVLAIPEIKRNLSGITYNRDSKTLFMITNQPTEIFEITKAGAVIRKIKLIGFDDTEGIVSLHNQMFAVIEERKRTVSIIKITPETQCVERDDVIKSLTFANEKKDNRGFEGIAYDQDNTLFVVNEKAPLRVYKISGWLEDEHTGIQVAYKLNHFQHFMDDFSGICFVPENKNLLFLSDESSMVAEVSLAGDHLGFLELDKGFSGLKDRIPQAEGIAIDDESTIYIVSEPNLLYIFKPEEYLQHSGIN